jgi:hypothetical protein
MRRRYYNAGATCALARLGLIKTAKDDGSGTLPALAAGGAIAATPFLGMIGEQPLRHDPIHNLDIPRVDSLEELSKRMQPGDVLVTARPGTADIAKTPQVATTGSRMHHVVPVVGTHPKTGRPQVLINSDLLYDYSHGKPRPNLMEDALDAARTLEKRYPEAVILRPNKPLSASDIARIREGLTLRAKDPFSMRQAVKNWLTDMFVPKVKGLGLGQQVCRGSICATAPAQVLHETAGLRVHPTKPAHGLLPADFLRSDAFTPIAAHIKPGRMGPKALKALRFGSRAGLGLLMGGGVALGLKKLLEKD